MSPFLCELKIPSVVIGVIAIVLGASHMRTAADQPIYLPASGPALYQRICENAPPATPETSVTPMARLYCEPARH